ncbi:MAG: hypothetical protein ACLU7Z_00800 [Eggerthellaceae bacterium]
MAFFALNSEHQSSSFSSVPFLPLLLCLFQRRARRQQQPRSSMALSAMP